MDVLARYVEPVKDDVACHQDWSKLWSNNSRHGGNTTTVIDSFVVDLGSKFEDGQGLFTISTSPLLDGTEKEDDGLESGDKEITTNAADESSMDSTHLSPATFMPPPHAPLKLVSAMKGSREKQGLNVGKLSVSWAADVYDPPVTSQSHSVSSHNNGNSRHKKNYRNKHNKNKAKSQRNCRKAKGSSRGGSY
ncbi:uncharacterized protein LOC124911136 [Impatiens glandulifera]|uniref:uncharacterized protein LOC124911136 n=1 Tax=Impatiens glandulifera TaxID=253017 RepID=UPI001FB18252|nr:uncharacterized protein LOC124911136 [Impatiens glandulifera]XP_047307533.1 uncharacterized protein LOC124911136 [Impatiens glandulifera]XP_047307534.1 uncharacterized protein LOC124911136 [Impatiens glandulifera]XP_047307535.1 uncharacterized protein LOC124911136 [Impatiens glandulifera]XP_047307536.1 uncharacterized protein LOC124911136 [Impatiens glandulifera]